VLLFGGSKPSTGYVTQVEAIKRETRADVLELSFRDGLADPDLPQSTVITHPFSAWELRKTTNNILLKNLEDPDDQVTFNLADAALLSSLGPEGAERALAKISDKDPVVRKVAIALLQEASSEASNRAVLSSLSAERDPTVILALFRFIRRHRSTLREPAILEAVRKNPLFSGTAHSFPGGILAKQVVRYLSESETGASTEYLQKHYFSLACRACPDSIIEVASLLARRKQLTSDIAFDFVLNYGSVERILSALSEFGDPRILEACLAGMERYVEYVSKICLRWFLKLSPETFGLDEKRPTTEQQESLKVIRAWLTKNQQNLRWNAETKKFEVQ